MGDAPVHAQELMEFDPADPEVRFVVEDLQAA
jgi:hypothetical protein